MPTPFVRSTNQLVRGCKDEIYGGESVPALWEQTPESVAFGKSRPPP